MICSLTRYQALSQPQAEARCASHCPAMHAPDVGLQRAAGHAQACREVPIMVPGVIGVSSTGVTGNKAYYSNYATRFVTVRLWP